MAVPCIALRLEIVPYTGAVKLHPQAVEMILAQGLPVEVDVASGSMAPTIEKGTRVKIEAVADKLHAGDIALILSSDGSELVLHRVIRLFTAGGQRFVIHQGDAPKSGFGVCPREAVLGRAVGFPATAMRVLPTLEVLDREALARFRRRRLVSLLHSLGRRMKFWLPGMRARAGEPPSARVSGAAAR